MSSIMDRLREVEGRAASGDYHSVRDRDASLSRMTDRGERTRGTGLKAGHYRAMAGIVTICFGLFAWVTWKGDSSRGRANEKRGMTSGVSAGDRRSELTPAQRTSSSWRDTTTRREENDSSSREGSVPSPREKEGASGNEASILSEKLAVPRGGNVLSAKETASDAVPASDDASGDVEASLPMGDVSNSSRSESRTDGGSPTTEEDQRIKEVLLGLKVTGVYRDARGYQAVIDGHEFREGEKLGEVEIAEITPKGVAFAFKGKRYRLGLR